MQNIKVVGGGEKNIKMKNKGEKREGKQKRGVIH